MHFGVDVSSNNPHPIAWPSLFIYLNQLGGGETPFAIVKISQGTGYANPDASDDIAAARAAGFIVGGYLMDQGNDDPASEEAVFRANAQGVPQFDDDELPEGLSTGAYIAHLQSLVAVDDVPQYLNQSEENEGFPAGAGIWEANYNGQPGVTHRAGVLIHQYTSSGTVPGAAGEFDLNCWTGSEAQFDQFFGITPPPPPPPPLTTGAVYMIPSGCTDNGAVQAQIKEWWVLYRSDQLSNAIMTLLMYCWNLPAGAPGAFGSTGFGHNPFLLLSNIIDSAGANLRSQFAGAV